jgi:hypothetical protein
MVPTRNVLVVSGSEDARGLAAMADLACQSIHATRTLCGTPFLLSDQGWCRFRPSDGALEARLRRVSIAVELRDYAAQKPVLEVLLRKLRERVHVAEAHGARAPGGFSFTWCAWTEGTDALLPCTDFITLARPGRPDSSLTVRWETAAEEVGALLEPTEVFPPRVRVRHFPCGERLRALERRSES